MVLVITMVLLSPVSRAAENTDQDKQRLHPFLEALSEAESDQWVDVIVGRRSASDEAAIAKAVGGKRLKAWRSVGAMLLRVQAKSLKALARQRGVRYVSPDAPMQVTTTPDPGALSTQFQETLDLRPFWDAGILGQGIGVAVIDSGIAPHADLQTHAVHVSFRSGAGTADLYGHGTHVAGIIAADAGDGQHMGMAPAVTLYDLNVTDSQGSARESDVLTALDWLYTNHARYNIRVVNMSMQSSVASSYRTSPLAGAVEKLWFAGVVVVVSSGNKGGEENSVWYAPANDPYVITVGAMDESMTADRSDDQTVVWSSSGVTQDGFAKPDVLAPGRRILSTMAPDSVIANEFAYLAEGSYIRLSGSSMAAPVISGAVALMLQRQPSLTPDQVKYLLTHETGELLPGQSEGDARVPDMAGVLSAMEITVPAANQGLTPSDFAGTGDGSTSSNVYYQNVYYQNVYYLNVFPDPSYYGD